MSIMIHTLLTKNAATLNNKCNLHFSIVNYICIAVIQACSPRTQQRANAAHISASQYVAAIAVELEYSISRMFHFFKLLH